MIKKKKILNTLKLVNIEPNHSALQHLRTMLMLYDTHMCKKKNERKETYTNAIKMTCKYGSTEHALLSIEQFNAGGTNG